MAPQLGTSPPSGGMNPTLPPTTKTTALPPCGSQAGFDGNRSRTSSESGNSSNEPALDKVETLSKVRSNLEKVVDQSFSLTPAEVCQI